MATLLLAGCDSPAIPPQDLPPLQDGTLTDRWFLIDEVDPRTASVVFQPGQECRVDAGYTRTHNPEDDWTYIALLILEDDTTRHPAGIVSERSLGIREQERIAADGTRTWTCQGFDGSPGKRVRFPKHPGTYEIRLCWGREPTTVADKRSHGVAPLLIMTPFYRAMIEVRPEE